MSTSVRSMAIAPPWRSLPSKATSAPSQSRPGHGLAGGPASEDARWDRGRLARSCRRLLRCGRDARAPAWPSREARMIEAAMIWNEPNNKSHWDPEIDPGWIKFADMAVAAGMAIRAASPHVPRVLGGISPIDPLFIANLAARAVLEHVDVVALHGFPLDWNLWGIDEWPAKIKEISATTSLPIWVTEVGVSS